MKYLIWIIIAVSVQAVAMPKALEIGCRTHGADLNRPQADIDRICSHD